MQDQTRVVQDFMFVEQTLWPILTDEERVLMPKDVERLESFFEHVKEFQTTYPEYTLKVLQQVSPKVESFIAPGEQGVDDAEDETRAAA